MLFSLSVLCVCVWWEMKNELKEESGKIKVLIGATCTTCWRFHLCKHPMRVKWSESIVVRIRKLPIVLIRQVSTKATPPFTLYHFSCSFGIGTNVWEIRHILGVIYLPMYGKVGLDSFYSFSHIPWKCVISYYKCLF